METQSSYKKFEFQRYPSDFFRYRLLWARKVPNLWKTPKKEKSESGADVWTKIGLRKTQADVWFEATRFRVLDRHRSTKSTTASRILNGVRSFGAPTHPIGSPSSHNAGVMWPELARCIPLAASARNAARHALSG